MPLRTPMLRLDWELSFVNQTIPKMVSLGLSAWTFLHSHHVILTWLTYHQHLRQGVCVCIIYIKYIYLGKNITEKNASLTTGKKNNKFNMIGWHNGRYAPQSTRFLHTWFVDTQFIRSEVQNHRAKTYNGTFSERSKKNTALKLSEIYNKGICGEKNSYVIFTHMWN